MNTHRIIVTTSVVTVTTLLAFIWWYKKCRKEKIPTEWKAVGKVSDLHMYPLKSGYRIELQEGECTKYGLKQVCDKAVVKLRDRFLIVYDEKHCEFKTARTHPKMVLIEVSTHDSDHIALDAPNMRTLYVKLPEIDEKNAVKITMHNKEPIDIIDCGDEAASWLSRYILDTDSGARLGYHNETHKDRTVERKLSRKMSSFYPNIRNNDLGVFADLSSFMLINQKSIKDLNTRLDRYVTTKQFRPNIIVENVEFPYVEDTWKWIKIGDDAIFRNIKPCTRCVFTTIDAETGIMDSNREPLKTLKEYRQLENEEERKESGNSPVMGVNLGLRKPGVIKVNDTVYVA